LSSTKLEKRAEQILPGSKEEGRGEREGVEKGVGGRGEKCPNNICTYE
jgi:hypothetical protein